MSASLSILHTCDLHGRLTEKQACVLREMKNQRAACILLDCGDALRAGNLNPGIGCRATIDRLNAAGYDAMAMGNREAHLWWLPVKTKLKGIGFPVLSTNIIHPRSPVEHQLVILKGGVRVGFLALTPMMTRAGSFFSHLVSVVFEDPMASARRAAATLRPQVDVLVVLSHLGRTFDQELAINVPDLDLILGGHDHSPGLPEGQWIGRTLLARSSPFGKDVGEVTLHDVSTNGSRVLAARLWPLLECGERDEGCGMRYEE